MNNEENSDKKQTKKKIVFYLRILAVFVTVGSIYIFAPWEAGLQYLKPYPDTIQEELNDAMWFEFDGMIVYVGKKGAPAEFYTAGWKNRADKIPADPQSLFKIASHRKLYIASAITRLAYNKQIDLTKTVGDYFPELVGRIANAEKITIDLLVQHRSGIPNFTDTPGFWEIEHESAQAVLELIFDQPALFEPDTDYSYSNTNYMLLTMLIDKVFEAGHNEYIRQNIIQPLGLQNTYMSLNDVNLDDVMSGYYVGIDEDIKHVNYNAMLATAEDLGLFVSALNEGRLFNKEEQAIYSSLYFYEHTGLIPGYQSFSTYLKEQETVLILFVNTTNFTGNTWINADVVFGRIGRMLKER